MQLYLFIFTASYFRPFAFLYCLILNSRTFDLFHLSVFIFSRPVCIFVILTYNLGLFVFFIFLNSNYRPICLFNLNDFICNLGLLNFFIFQILGLYVFFIFMTSKSRPICLFHFSDFIF